MHRLVAEDAGGGLGEVGIAEQGHRAEIGLAGLRKDMVGLRLMGNANNQTWAHANLLRCH